jgi:hypothetical protein
MVWGTMAASASICWPGLARPVIHDEARESPTHCFNEPDALEID